MTINDTPENAKPEKPNAESQHPESQHPESQHPENHAVDDQNTESMPSSDAPTATATPEEKISRDANFLNSSTPASAGKKKPPKKRSWFRRLLLWLLVLFIALVALLGILTTTDEGSRRLLGMITSSQHMIKYEYGGGNFQEGLLLYNVEVKLTAVDVHVQKAMLKIGWRAIVQKELHFRYASLSNIKVIKKTPPSDDPFEFKALKLPFTLRFDSAFVHNLDIQTKPGSNIKLNDIVLRDALWSGDELSLEQSSLVLPYLSVRDVTGRIQFRDKYPLHVDAKLLVPSLNSINIQQIFVAARGDLDTVKAGLAIVAPDLLTGSVVAHPVRKDVPFSGRLDWESFHWPLASAQHLFSKKGEAQISGNASDLSIVVNTDLAGSSLPYGEYQSQLTTDFKGLTIQAFNGQLMGGTLQSQGQLNWTHQLSWKLNGRLSGLKGDEKNIPQAARAYLPPVINGHIFSEGQLGESLSTLNAGIKLDNQETWLAGVARKGAIGNAALPLAVDARWYNLNRTLPTVGHLNSPKGQVLVSMQQQELKTSVDARIVDSENGLIPGGQYTASVIKKDNLINIPSLLYTGVAGEFKGAAKLQLPKDKQNLLWSAQLLTSGYDPTKISKSAPFNKVSGVINANGKGGQDRQTIELKQTKLIAQMPAANGKADRTVELTGNTTAVLLLYPQPKATTKTVAIQQPKAEEKLGASKTALQKTAPQKAVAKPPSGLKSFAVQFIGAFKTPDVPNGSLIVKVSGTPKLIKIDQFDHNGAAGKINLRGQVDLSQGPAWQVNGLLNQFNPGFFVAGYDGQITGGFNTTGHWQTARRDFQLNNLGLSGVLKGKPVIGQGAVHVEFNANAKEGLWPKRFDAQNLLLSFAGNRIAANGNSQRLAIDVDASSLNQLNKDLSGSVVGQLTLTGDERRPDVTANLKVNKLAYGTYFSLQQASLVGRLPQLGSQPSQLVFSLQNLKRAQHSIQNAKVALTGTQVAHVLQVSADNQQSKFYVQLAGGFNDAYDWLGQIQKGKFDSKRISLTQNQAAAFIYKAKDKSVYIDKHCWLGAGSSFCLVEPLQAGAAKGLVSVQLQNLDLASFQALMPEGVAWSGKLFGNAKATWAANTAPTLDAEIHTDNGTIGLAPEDPQDLPLALPYQRLSLIAKTQIDGIKFRFDAKTPGIGAGYVDATINPNNNPKTINGALVLNDVQLSVLKPFFPGMRVLNGVASLGGGISGPLTSPDFYGEFNLKDAQVAMNNLPINLNRINLSSSIQGKQADLKGSFYSGDGLAQLTGAATWDGVPKVHLNLAGDKLLVRQAPMLSARVTPNIDVDILPTQRQVTVNGTVDIPSAVVSMPQSSENVIAKSADVRVVRLNENNNVVLKAAKPWAIYADIALKLGNDVYFRGFGSSIPLGGELNLTQRGLETGMRGTGAIGVRQMVTIEAYGQRLQLNRGIARFNGNLTQPSIDIDATKSISNRTVGVRVTGRATNPNIAIYNDAGLTEQEALNALLTGRISSATTSVNNTAGFKSDVSNTVAAAGLSMGLGGFRNITNRIGRTVGLNALTVDAEGVGDDTQVALTGYITPDLFLRYGVGVFTPVNRLTLRYQINRRLYVEASSALDRAIDMFYNWRF